MVTYKEKITRIPCATFCRSPRAHLTQARGGTCSGACLCSRPTLPKPWRVLFVGFFPYLAWTGWALQINGFPIAFSRCGNNENLQKLISKDPSPIGESFQPTLNHSVEKWIPSQKSIDVDTRNCCFEHVVFLTDGNVSGVGISPFL